MNTSLRLGHLGLLDSAPLLVAAQRGLFREEGLEVELTCELGLATLCAKLIDGRLAGACVPAALPVLLSLNVPFGSAPIDVACLVTSQDMAIVRAAPTERPVPTVPRSPFRIGIPAQLTHARFLVQRWLQHHPLPAQTEAALIPLSITQLPSFFHDRLIDAFCAIEPLPALAAVEDTTAVSTSSGQLYPLHPGTALALRAERTRSDPELRPRLQRALRRANAFCQSPDHQRELWALLRAQPSFAALQPAPAAGGGDEPFASPPRHHTRFIDCPGETTLTADGAAFLEDVCRSAARLHLRGQDVTGQIRRLYQRA